MTTITILPHELPSEAVKAGGKALNAWLNLYALASGLKNVKSAVRNDDGSYTLTGDAQVQVLVREHSANCRCFRCDFNRGRK